MVGMIVHVPLDLLKPVLHLLAVIISVSQKVIISVIQIHWWMERGVVFVRQPVVELLVYHGFTKFSTLVPLTTLR